MDQKFDSDALNNTLAQFAGKRIVCVGDVMLDRFVYGDVSRTSPEAPIPVLHYSRETTMLGGAGNAASNLASLDAQVTLAGFIGDDKAGRDIQALALEKLKNNDGLLVHKTRPTIEKTRFIASNQQLLRLDVEQTQTLDNTSENSLIAFIDTHMKDCDGILISDYGKGIITPYVAQAVIKAAHTHNIPVLIDPKGTDFTKYNGATVVKPNLKELATVTGMPVKTDKDVEAAARHVLNTTTIQTLIVTRSEQGMSVITRDSANHIKTKPREVYDVSGAGDTVGATLLLALSAGATATEAALFGNLAGGLAVSKIGTAVIRRDELGDILMDEMVGDAYRKHPIPGLHKLQDTVSALEKINLWRAKGDKIGFTNGYFDLIHPGHLSLLEQAKKQCDRLVVAINSDASHALNKSRPLVQQDMARAAVMGALEYVDMVILFDTQTPLDLIKAINPDVLVKGNDYPVEQVLGADFVLSQGKRVFLAEIDRHYGTTFEKLKITG